MKIKKLTNKKGFTLVELLVVIAIIGILATVLIPSYSSYIRHTRVELKKQEILEFKKRMDYAIITGKEYTFTKNGNTITKVFMKYQDFDDPSICKQFFYQETGISYNDDQMILVIDNEINYFETGMYEIYYNLDTNEFFSYED